MNLIEVFFGSTQKFKQKTRKQLTAWLIPLRMLEVIFGPILATFFTIDTYMVLSENQLKISWIAYLMVAVFLLLMYSKFIKWLKNWQTNSRMKWLLMTLVKFIPILAIMFGVHVVTQDVSIFVTVLDKVFITYMISFVFNYFAEPLSVELRVRDKIKLNSENNRVVD